MNSSLYSFVAAADREMISAAIREWEKLTCLTFEQLPMTTQYEGQFILFTNEMGSGYVHTFDHGRISVGDGGTRPPPTFQLGGDHIGNVPPPLFGLKSRKYHVCSSSSNLHSFVRLRNRHMLVEIASEHVPHPVPHRSTPMDA